MSDIIEVTSTSKALEGAIKVLKASSPVLAALTGLLIDSARETEKLAESGEIENLDAEAKKQAISLNMARMQASVAQELAIAERIKDAYEVEIEEYYEGSGAAGLNVNASVDSASIGLGGQSHKVVKRVYRFTGKKSGDNET